MRCSKTPRNTLSLVVLTSGALFVQDALFCPLASAQDGEPQYPECNDQLADTTAAKGAFQAGTAAFNEADYERAITYWEDAYRRDCQAHALLKNLARAYELNGMYAKAIVALRTFMEREPLTEERESLERRITNLETKLQEQQAGTTPVDPAESTVPRDEATTMDSAEQAIEPPATASGSKSVVPLAVAGAGGAIALLGGVLWIGATADEQAAADQCGVPETRMNCPPDAVTDGRDAQDRAVLWGWVAGGGAAIGIGGLIWYLTQPDDANSARFSPAVAPGFAGVSYAGRF